ncbi:MAG TPA: hypothetical protein VLS90_00825, partial [Thermodesulfobacteriota bacterium]|nr:hypothetical protein [Thermodesulfobacteriota bacterium]
FSKLTGPIQELLEALNAVNALPKSAFKNRNMKKNLANKINAAILAVNNAVNNDYSIAIAELNDILKKINGCADKGAPEPNDWIIDCAAQGTVYPHIVSAINQL